MLGGGESGAKWSCTVSMRERERKSLRLSFVLSAFTLIYRHYPLNIRTLLVHCSSLSATTIVKQILQHVFTKHLLTSDQLVSIVGMTFCKTYYFSQFLSLRYDDTDQSKFPSIEHYIRIHLWENLTKIHGKSTYLCP